MRYLLSVMSLLLLAGCNADRATLGDRLIGFEYELRTVNWEPVPHEIRTQATGCEQFTTIHSGSLEFLDAQRVVLEMDVEVMGEGIPHEREFSSDTLQYSGSHDRITFRVPPTFVPGFVGNLLNNQQLIELGLHVGGTCGPVPAVFSFHLL